jgi:DNA-binding HxlR family transcriptional regulator
VTNALLDYRESGCPVERTLAILGAKWTTLIVRELLAGPRRFGELRSALEGVSPKTLTERLRALEAEGLIERRQFPEVPPRVEYQLTDAGQTLRSVLDAMAAWGASHPDAGRVSARLG